MGQTVSLLWSNCAGRKIGSVTEIDLQIGDIVFARECVRIPSSNCGLQPQIVRGIINSQNGCTTQLRQVTLSGFPS
jgi:hypothetical protein